MSLDKINQYHIILASQSPRRQYLMQEIGINYEIQVREVDEQWPKELRREEIPLFLCELKSEAFHPRDFRDDTILITADTIVFLDDEVVGKPRDRDDAIQILNKLSGRKHEVITGVCLRTNKLKHSFTAESEVWFRPFAPDEIEWYIDTYKPYDKAGAYGIQEWIGYVGIERITGSFYNVMGLPTQRLYIELLKLIGSM